MHGPSLSDIRSAARRLRGKTVHTPVLPLATSRWDDVLPEGSDVCIKLELFQQAGSFKARGAYLGIEALDAAQMDAGVVAASGGNHALAVAWASRAANVSATIAMPQTVDPLRIERVKALGAELFLTPDMPAAFGIMEDRAASGQTMMHPFEAEHMTLGAATCGLEFAEDAPHADVFVLPVGGGGLISGMACAIKQMNPNAQIIGVEPVGADSLTRSLAAGKPVTLDRIDTIADSLSAPKALPYSFAVAQAYVDEMVHVTDQELCRAMGLMLDNNQLVAEPACAAGIAAITGPLHAKLAGRKIGVIACGANLGLARFQELISSQRSS